MTALQQEAQRLASSGDVSGAQSKAKEAESIVKQAQNTDPKQFVRMKTETKKEQVKIGAIVDDALYSDGIMIALPTAERLASKDMMMVTQMYVQAKPGANVEQLGKDLKKAVKPFYTVSVLTRDEFKSSMSSMINSMLSIIYALLALSIIIAIFGIVNTLALNVSERTKEIGLLRAIGTSNGQARHACDRGGHSLGVRHTGRHRRGCRGWRRHPHCLRIAGHDDVDDPVGPARAVPRRRDSRRPHRQHLAGKARAEAAGAQRRRQRVTANTA